MVVEQKKINHEWGQENVRTMQNAWEDKRVQWLEENPTLDGLLFHLKFNNEISSDCENVLEKSGISRSGENVGRTQLGQDPRKTYLEGGERSNVRELF